MTVLKNQLNDDSSGDEPRADEAKQAAINQDPNQAPILEEQSASISSQPSSADHVRLIEDEGSEPTIPVEQEPRRPLSRGEFYPQEDDIIRAQFAIAEIETTENVDLVRESLK